MSLKFVFGIYHYELSLLTARSQRLILSAVKHQFL